MFVAMVFSFILGWFVLPKIVDKIKKGVNIKVFKYFYPNKSVESNINRKFIQTTQNSKY